MKRVIIAIGMAASLAACTTNPAYNTGAGALGGAAAGCGIGALVTLPLAGVGCVPGAIIGGAVGGTAGAASTQPPAVYNQPPSYYYPPY